MARGKRGKKRSSGKKSFPVLGTLILASPFIKAGVDTMRTKNVNTAIDTVSDAFIGYRPSNNEITWGKSGGTATLALVAYLLFRKFLNPKLKHLYPKGLSI